MDTATILQHLNAAGAEMRHCSRPPFYSTEITGQGPDRFIVSCLAGERTIHLLTPDGLGHRLSAEQAQALAATLAQQAERLAP
jgi:hypothetical protein